MTAAEHLGDRLDHVRDANLDVLDPDFAVAMDDLARELREQAGMHALFEALDVRGLPENRYVASARACVGAVRTFTAMFVERSTLNPGIADEYLRGLEVTRDDEMRRRGRRGN